MAGRAVCARTQNVRMKVLVLGGTQFVGRHIALHLLSAGHTVSIFNRGQSAGELPASVERLRGDRDAGAIGLGALTGRVWDACVDVSGHAPRHSNGVRRECARR